MITIVIRTLETMNQLKNGFSAQDVRSGSIATVSLIDNGWWNLILAIPYIFLTVFLSDISFDFLDFYVARKKRTKSGNFTTR